MSAQKVSVSSGVPVSGASLVRAGAIAVLATVAANFIARLILIPLLNLDPNFPPFGVVPIVLFTFVGTALGVLVFAILQRRVAHPWRTFNIVAFIALIISILPNIGLMFNPSGMPFPGANAANFAILILYHIIAWGVFMVALGHLLKPSA